MSEKQINHSQRFGIILVLSCGIMWGISGVLGQYVFQSSDVNATQLSIIRQFNQLLSSMMTNFRLQ